MRDVPVPVPAPDEVRIRVLAAGVNFPDVLIIQNLYQTKHQLPFIPGAEVAGVVDAVGKGVTEFAVGDRVAALTGHSGFAEQVVVREAKVVGLPASMPFDEGASWVLTYGTSYHALHDRAALEKGETLLVLGAGGGVGLAAVELGVRMGARVIAAASSSDKLAVAKSRGADLLLQYGECNFRERLNALTDKNGIDVVYDPVGGSYTEQAFRALRWNGRHLVVGFADGMVPKLPVNLALVKGASLIGVYWGNFIAYEPEAQRQNQKTLDRWYLEGVVRPQISKSFAFEDAPMALRHMMDRKAVGKIIVTLH